MPLAQAKQVQQLLAKRGYDVGKIDGVIGAATRNAIREMQVKYGLPADGYPTTGTARRASGAGGRLSPLARLHAGWAPACAATKACTRAMS